MMKVLLLMLISITVFTSDINATSTRDCGNDTEMFDTPDKVVTRQKEQKNANLTYRISHFYDTGRYPYCQIELYLNINYYFGSPVRRHLLHEQFLI